MGKFKWLGTKLGIIKPDDDDDDDVDLVPPPQRAVAAPGAPPMTQPVSTAPAPYFNPALDKNK